MHADMSRKKKRRQMKKTQPHRRLTPLTKAFCFILIGVSAVMLYFAVREVMNTFYLQKQLADIQIRLQEAEDQNKYLNSEKEKLQDPDYVENYARGNYMLSKEGEQIFYLPEDPEKQSSQSN